MRNVLNIFFRSEGANWVIVVVCMLASSLLEGVGLATMLPLLTIATGSGGSHSIFNEAVHTLFRGYDQKTTIALLLLMVVTSIVVKALLMLLAMRYVGFAVAEVSTRFRAKLVRQILSVRWSYLLANPLGRFINAVSSQAGMSGEAYRLAASFMALVIETTVLVGMTFFVSWRLAIAAILLGVTTATGSNFLVRRARASARRANARNRELVTFLADAMGNIKLLKSMARQDSFENLLERKISQLRKAARQQVMNRELLGNLQDATIAIALGFAAFLAICVWDVAVADLIVVGLLLARTVRNLGKLQGQYQAAAVMESPYEDLMDLLREAEVAAEGKGGPGMPSLDRGCRLDRVTFGYTDVPVFSDVSIEVEAHRLTVITGASGQGKTTIADLLIGLYHPGRGQVLVDGVPLPELDLRRWRRMIGYVPQDVILFHDTILSNLTLGDPELGADEARRALELAGALAFVDSLPGGLWTVVGERGGKLSGGQRQRIGIARALVHRPKLLILDEVTSALDPETERALCQNIRELRREATIFAITHRPALVEWADAVYRLEEGIVRPQAQSRLAAV